MPASLPRDLSNLLVPSNVCGVLLVFGRRDRMHQIDPENRCAVVEPGVVNREITRAVERAGWYFAPDPSSQKDCATGGNVAENAGGSHT